MSTLSILEGAAFLKIERKKMEELIHDGVIPAAKIGRSWVMLERHLMKYLETQIINQTAARIGQPARTARSTP